MGIFTSLPSTSDFFAAKLESMAKGLEQAPSFSEHKEDFDEIDLAKTIKRYMTSGDEWSEQEIQRIERQIIPLVTLSSTQCIKILRWVAAQDGNIANHVGATWALSRYLSWRALEIPELDKIATSVTFKFDSPRFCRLMDGVHDLHVLLKRIQ